jgi:hypothetical protein
MANYLHRVAAAGAQTRPPATPAVMPSPRMPDVAPPPFPISLPEPSDSAGLTAAPESTAPPASSPDRESPVTIPPQRESPNNRPAASSQPATGGGIAPQPDAEATQEGQQPPDSLSVPPPSDTPLHALRPSPGTEPSARPTQLQPPRRMAGSAHRLPSGPPNAPLPLSPAPSVPFTPPAHAAPLQAAPEGSAPRERLAVTPPHFPVTRPQSQPRETRHKTGPAANSPTPAAQPQANRADPPASRPRPVFPAAPRKNETRISIGRIDVQVNNHPRQPPVAPTPASRPPRHEINLEYSFLTRFPMRP